MLSKEVTNMKFRVGIKSISTISRVIKAVNKAEAQAQIKELLDIQKLNDIDEWAEEIVEKVA
jgi:hypothetical protein